MDKGLGAVTWWGFSPALDLIEYLKLQKANRKDGELNILLVGSGDIRHILKTLAQSHRHSEKFQLHFYILENNLEVYARHLLLSALVLGVSERMGLQEKTELLLEIFGNTLLRTQTAGYVQTMANEFVRMVTDFDYLNEKLPLFNLEQLKYKERDMLEGIFKMWRSKDLDAFIVEKCWDLRVRSHLGMRYDSSNGVFDWDFNMKICERGGQIIGSRLYRSWRKHGKAFTLREAEYNVPNKTLCSGMIFNVGGERTGRRGYWGDIVTSPYISFGIDCDDERMYKKANKEYVKTAEDISQYNVTSLLHELQTKEKYVAPDEAGGDNKTPEMTTITEDEEEDTEDKKPEIYQSMSCPGVKITFLPLNSVPDISKKVKYQGLFDMVYFSNSMVHLLQPGIENIFKGNALLVLETAKFMLELNKEQYMEFSKRIKLLAANVGCESFTDCDDEKDSFSFFEYRQA